MQKINWYKRKRRPARRRVLFVLLVAVMLMAASFPSVSRADQYDDQIQSLQQQNAQKQDAVSALQEQATSYEDAINRLQSQIEQVQQQISDSQNKQAALQTQIQSVQHDLDTQRGLLGQVLRTMYVDGEPTMLEELATSKDISEFVDKQAYRESVQVKVQNLLSQITQLRNKLGTEKAEVDKLLQDQRSQQDQLTGYQNKQAELLAYNQSQQAGYTQQIQANQSEITRLRAEQARLISRYQVGGTLTGDPNHGGYPRAWNDAPMDTLLDSWGMYNRECVSYTAFKVHQDYVAGKNRHDMPYWGGIGDAKQWPGDARAAGIPVDYNPTPGSIAISTAGTWGHSMYVERVGTLNGQPAIYVSQYNADWNGHYSEGWRYTTGLVFIHF